MQILLKLVPFIEPVLHNKYTTGPRKDELVRLVKIPSGKKTVTAAMKEKHETKFNVSNRTKRKNRR